MKPVKPKPFWMVHVDGSEAPRCRHETFAKARIEASRLACQTGKTAFVLRSVERATPVTSARLEPIR